MKRLEELALSFTDVTGVLPKVITDQVEFIARARRVARALVKENRDLVGAKGRTLYVPTRGTLAVFTLITPGTDLSTASFAGTNPTNFLNTQASINVAKLSAGIQISQEALDGAFIDVIDSSIEEAGLALADREDKDIIAQSYWDGSAASRVTALPVTTKTGDLLRICRTNIIAQNWIPTIAIINPAAEKDLLSDPTFIDASAYGGREPILNGELGKALGLRILVSQNVSSATFSATALVGYPNIPATPTGVAATFDKAVVVVDPERAGWLVLKREIDMKRWDNPRTDSIELYFFLEYGAKFTITNALYIAYTQ